MVQIQNTLTRISCSTYVCCVNFYCVHCSANYTRFLSKGCIQIGRKNRKSRWISMDCCDNYLHFYCIGYRVRVFRCHRHSHTRAEGTTVHMRCPFYTSVWNMLRRKTMHAHKLLQHSIVQPRSATTSTEPTVSNTVLLL